MAITNTCDHCGEVIDDVWREFYYGSGRVSMPGVMSDDVDWDGSDDMLCTKCSDAIHDIVKEAVEKFTKEGKPNG